MRSPFTHNICFNAPAPALAGHGQPDPFVIAVPGQVRPFEEKSRLPANVTHNDIHSQAKSVYDYGIPRLFTRFSRKADDIDSTLCQFEDAVWDVATSSCF